MNSSNELHELERRIRVLCERAIADMEARTTINKETVQVLETVNKMLGVFAERDAKRPAENPFEGKSIEELTKALHE